MRGRSARAIAVVGAAAVVAVLGARWPAGGATPARRLEAAPRRLEAARLSIELNATDGDAGLQVFLNGAPWRELALVRPDGREILRLEATGPMRRFGLTELFSESSEPPFTRLPLEEFLALFPEGRYRLLGRTVDRRRLIGAAPLSHALPAPPEILAPADGAAVPADGSRVRWRPGPPAPAERVVAFEVTVEREDPLRTFSVQVPAGVRGVRVPGAYLEPGVEYALEVVALEEGGNRTLTAIAVIAR
jgi:hypothetical protein